MIAPGRHVRQIVLAVQRVGVSTGDDDDLLEAGVYVLFDDELDGWFVYYRKKLFGIAERHGQHPRSGTGCCYHSSFNFH